MADDQFRVMYLTYDGRVTIMAFSNQRQAVQWLTETQRMKTVIEQINEDAPHELPRTSVDRVEEWVNLYINDYLRRWGDTMVAVDVKRAVISSNNNLPENRRLIIPQNVRGTETGCTMSISTIDEALAD